MFLPGYLTVYTGRREGLKGCLSRLSVRSGVLSKLTSTSNMHLRQQQVALEIMKEMTEKLRAAREIGANSINVLRSKWEFRSM